MTSTDKITVYTPESPLRHPLRLLAAMWRDLLAARGLAWRLLVRDISAQYRQSFLGYFWAFLPPVAVTGSFMYLQSQNIINSDNTGVPYGAYVAIGTILWTTFVDALNSPIKAINAGRAMLAKINFPREALLMAALGEILFNLCIRLLLLIPVFLMFKVPVTASLLLAPVGIASLILLGASIGLIILPAAMMFNDLARGIGLATNFWMLLTPVVYTTPREGMGALLAKWNPVSPVLTTAREWLIGQPLTHFHSYLLVMAVAFVVLLIGWLLFRVTMPIVVERMGG